MIQNIRHLQLYNQTSLHQTIRHDYTNKTRLLAVF